MQYKNIPEERIAHFLNNTFYGDYICVDVDYRDDLTVYLGGYDGHTGCWGHWDLKPEVHEWCKENLESLWITSGGSGGQRFVWFERTSDLIKFNNHYKVHTKPEHIAEFEKLRVKQEEAGK